MVVSFTLSKEQQLLQDVAREFAQKEVAPKAAEMDRTRKLDLGIVKKYRDQGFHLVTVPKEYGGQGRSGIDRALVIEEMAVASNNMATATMNVGCGALPVMPYFTDEAKKRWVPYLLKDTLLFAGVDSEPDAGSDSASIRASGKREGNQWVLNGLKRFCTLAEYADAIIATVRTSPDRYHGLDSFIIPKGTPGMKLGKPWRFMGATAIGNTDVILENCRLPLENQLSKPGQGFYFMMYTFGWGRYEAALCMLGAGRAAFEASVKHCRERKAFGKPIGEFQLQTARLAEMRILVDAARLLIWRGIDLMDSGQKFDAEASIAKAFCSEAMVKVTSEAMTVFGGYGIAEDYPIERYYRDVKAWTLGDGTIDIQKLIIGTRVLGRKKIVLDHAPGYE